MICDSKCHLCVREECIREKRLKERKRAYYEANRDERIKYQREYRKTHREEYLEYLREYAESHKQQKKEYDHQRWLRRKDETLRRHNED